MTTPADLFARFQELVLRADDQSKRAGAPDAETRLELNTLSAIMAASDAERARQQREHAAFIKALRYGPRAEDLPHLKLAAEDDEWKVMTQTDDQTGGFVASPQFVADLTRALAALSPVRQVARVVETTSVGSLIPVRSGTLTASRVSETETRVADDDLAFKLGQINVREMSVFTKVSRTLLADAQYDIAAELALAAAEAFAALEASEFISGDGVNGMVGLTNANLPTANKITCADSSGHLVSIDDLLKLIYKSVDAQYIAGGRLLINPVLLGTLRTLKATTGNTFLAPIQDTPNTFLGVPFLLTSDLADNATPAAGKVVAAFIHPAAYTVVQRESMVVQRMPETFAEQGLVGFSIRMRQGGGVVLPAALSRLVTA